MSALARVPIRLRLTLGFAVAMAVVLAATGFFLYLRLGAELDESIDRGLRTRAQDVAATLGVPALPVALASWQKDGLTQVLQPSGAVVQSSPQLGDRSLLSWSELSNASRGAVTIDRRTVPRSDDGARLLATPVDVQGARFVVVVGSSLEARGEALESLLTQLLIGGPIALLLSSLAAYALAAAALRPVESMRREAQAVSAEEPGRRLPLPAADDEIARLGETLNSMLGRLEGALARERRFVSDASHELRTPLATLRAELELALRRDRTKEELEQALRSAAEETDRLSQLAEDLLVLARAQGGDLPVRQEQLPVRDLLAGAAERFAGRAADTGRTLDVRADEGVELFADRLRIEQALGNLVENALRHGSGPIVLEAKRRHGRIELHVRDRGPGFQPEFIGRAFEPFSRTDPARQSPGAGLGLAIVDVIARAHGGVARAANVGGGADVWLELP